MSVPAALVPLFSNNARTRGGDYAASGAVGLQSITPTSIDAIVRGGAIYDVHLEYEHKASSTTQTLIVSCTCPHFFGGNETCKHLWATIVVAGASVEPTFLTRLENQDPGTVAIVPEEGSQDESLSYFAPVDDVPEPDWRTRRRAETPSHWTDWNRRGQGQPSPRPAPKPRTPAETLLRAVSEGQLSAEPVATRSADGPIIYILDLDAARRLGGLQIEIAMREPRKSGGWTQPRPPRLTTNDLASLPAEDSTILSALLGATLAAAGQYGGYPLPTSFVIPTSLARIVLPLIAKTGRAHVRNGAAGSFDLAPVVWDDGPPWIFRFTAEPDGQELAVSGAFARGAEILAPNETLMAFESGFLMTSTTIARAQLPQARALFAALLHLRRVVLSPTQVAALTESLAQSGVSSDELPAELRVQEIDVAPVRHLQLSTRKGMVDIHLLASPSFVYDGTAIADDGAPATWDAARSRLIRRKSAIESAAMAQLKSLGMFRRWDTHEQEQRWMLAASALPRVVRTLVSDGWQVEASGKRYHASDRVSMSVSSGVDWFDLQATVEFAGETVPLTDVLAALKRGDPTVTLDDGSLGLLPETWLARYAPLASMGEIDGDRLRFQLPQTMVLDALLEAQADDVAVQVDERFTSARRALAGFESIAPAQEAATFHGTLRPYQRDGLGWFSFLQRFGFGGCLADDMGLGKTVMVLALFESIRAARATNASSGDVANRPSLVVAPRSVVHNWLAEAARFTPLLRMRDGSHATRRTDESLWHDTDVIVTTYGLLRRDISILKDREFEYVVLDEAQAIKNASTAAAKAARLLRARHRLALSGTPIENHLGELWSLVEFLNPGMLGRSSVFARTGAASARTVDPETATVLARAVRPFMLRRTKAQVATELPPRTEQTIVCELEGKQRTLYQSLRDHYRRTLLGRIERTGLAKSKLQVLEALLRLRQAACHPALVDPALATASSAKLDALIPKLREVVDEGHKAIVFSQFTSFLSLVKAALNKEGLVFEYLDGATKDRAAPVERFQTDPACGVFLVSLKAGGLGLNLTAAEYVFLLDPWWNPAVEAQAIDRAHRIGQTRHVFAYRLIASDTVEEKVIQLQNTKRALADAILRADAGLIGQLGKEDIEMLLG